MASESTVKVVFLGDSSKLKGELDGLDSKVDKSGSMFDGFGKKAALGLGAGGLAAGAAFIHFGQMGNALDAMGKKAATVFEGSKGDIDKWADSNAKAFGLTDDQLTGLAANFGDLLKPMGFTSAQAATMSKDVVGLSGALSAWSGGTVSASEASDILAKAMLGERDGLKSLGIAISEADVQARLAKNGTDKLTGSALEQAKAVATQQLIFEKSTDAQKAWADGSMDAVKSQNSIKSSIEELKEKIATGLQPAFAATTTFLVSKVIPAMERLGGFLSDKLGPVFAYLRRGLSQFTEAFRYARDGGWEAHGTFEKLGVFVAQDLIPAFQRFARFVRDEVVPRLQQFAGFVRDDVVPVLLQLADWIRDRVITIFQTLSAFTTDTLLPAFQRFGDWLQAEMLPRLERLGAWIMENVVPALQRLADYLIGTVLPAFLAVVGFIVERVIPVLAEVALFIIDRVVPVLGQIAVFIMEKVIPAIAHVVEWIIEKLIPVFQGIYDVVTEKIVPAVATIVEKFGEIVTKVKEVYDGVVEKFGEMVTFITEIPGKVTAAIGSFVTLLFDKGKDLINGLWNGAIEIITDFFKWVTGLPGRILGAIGDLSRLLFDIGRAIMLSLWEGMKDVWEDVKGWLGGLGGWIKDLKGPIYKDRVLLTPEGRAIMTGLHDGMKDGWSPIPGWLEDIGDSMVSRASEMSDAMSWAVEDMGSLMVGSMSSTMDTMVDVVSSGADRAVKAWEAAVIAIDEINRSIDAADWNSGGLSPEDVLDRANEERRKAISGGATAAAPVVNLTQNFNGPTTRTTVDYANDSTARTLMSNQLRVALAGA